MISTHSRKCFLGLICTSMRTGLWRTLPNDILIIIIIMTNKIILSDGDKSWEPLDCSSNILTHYQTTNFRLFQTERVCRRQFQIWRKWKKVIQTGRKHCGKRRKLLVTSNFSFSNSVFKRLVFQRCQKVSLCGNGLTLFQTSPGFYMSAIQVLWKHCGKRRNCSWWAISPFPTAFSTHLGKFSAIFIKFEIVVCKLFQYGTV